jgi:hypothetical protein
MADLMDLLEKQDIGITSTGDTFDIVGPGIDGIMLAMDVFDWGPVWLPQSVIEGTAGAAWIGRTFGFAMAYVGPLYGMAGMFMALGAPYEKAREEIKNEAVQSGFSQGFVAGILNMSPSTTRELFGDEGVDSHTRNTFDPESDYLKVNAYNRGLIAGYALANTCSKDEKESYVLEIRQYVTGVSAGEWTDLDKRNYVIEYAAKLRLHYLSKVKPYEPSEVPEIDLATTEDVSPAARHVEHEDAPPPPPYPGDIVEKGSKDRDLVEQIQQALLSLGYDLGEGGADGAYGNDTLAAVSAFQTDRGIGVDGRVGSDTWDALFGT